MKTDEIRETTQAFESLRQFARRPRRAVEVCEMCSLELRPEHAHLVELTERRLHCACDACAMLFSNRSDAKYKRVPRDVRLLAEFQMSDADWDGLLIPINLAFFFQNSLDSRVRALYPSPAGATESLLPLEAWANIVGNNPILNSMEADVEALLANRVGASRGLAAAEYYIVPIDACYKLVGLIRMHWHGLSGGAEVWKEVGAFFTDLRSKAEVVTDKTHA
ncbi:MAG TPA: DUF5947 family protein [Candidatus Binatia bacterium]|nr:DUF5947 family protein [Candidatus Binatia bacterium]